MERLVNNEIASPKDYYSHPNVAKAIYQYLGVEEIEYPIRLLDTGRQNVLNIVKEVKSEYLTVSNLDIKHQKQGRAPARSVKAWEIPVILQRNALTEIYQSFWQIDAPDQENLTLEKRKPHRSLMCLDIEYFHKTYPGKVLTNQLEIFELLEPTYNIISQEFNHYDIPFMAVMTGRGYHFVSQVPYISAVMDQLIKLGSHLESSVRSSQESIPYGSKRDRLVPIQAGMAHKGLALLIHYLVNKTIDQIRQESKINIQVSDMGNEAVAIDLTPNLLRAVHNNVIGTAGSLYLKPFIKKEIYGDQVVAETRLLSRIPRSANKIEFASLSDLIQIRQHRGLSAEYLGKTSGIIPDGSRGIQELIDDYNNSELKKLHDVLDTEADEPPENWEKKYRNYNEIAGSDDYLRWAFTNANDALLKPDVLNYVINTLYENWGGRHDIRKAASVRTFLRSVYEDPLKNWGNRFIRHYSAEQQAIGWTAMMLGPHFKEKH
jgi:hypothetical protein